MPLPTTKYCEPHETDVANAVVVLVKKYNACAVLRALCDAIALVWHDSTEDEEYNNGNLTAIKAIQDAIKIVEKIE